LIEQPLPDTKNSTLARVIIGVVAAFLGLMLIGGVVFSLSMQDQEADSKQSSGSNWPPDDSYTPPQSNSDTLADAAWLALLSEWPGAASVGRDKMEEFADITCAAFDGGVTFEEAAILAYDSGFSSSEAGTIIGYAIFGFCPEHAGLIP
jgi:hypothetical protein